MCVVFTTIILHILLYNGVVSCIYNIYYVLFD